MEMERMHGGGSAESRAEADGSGLKEDEIWM
jgi:hypothetical protein